MQIYNVREGPTKYHCCDCGKRLVARAKTPQWRDIPADQKRCRSCSMKYRLELKRAKKRLAADVLAFTNLPAYNEVASPIPKP